MPGAYNKGSIRRAQLITTYGVGAIVASGDESFMVAGINHWPADASLMFHEPRLQHQLGVQSFLLPPAQGYDKDVPVVRFPDIHYCPSCRRLDRHSFFTSYNKNTCNVCGVDLIPSRFITVCEHGHIDDFPYFEWLHRGRTSEEDAHRKHVLRFEAGGVSASLSDIVISCSCGVPPRSLAGAFARDALRGIKRCSGNRPWIGDRVDCDQIPRTLQRGASNVYFPVVRSAISIPPWSEGAFKLINLYWKVLSVIPEAALAPTIAGLRIADGTSHTVDDLVEAVLQRKSGNDLDSLIGSESTLRNQEYQALVRGRIETERTQEFVCVPAPGTSALVSNWFSQVMTVTKLREVRALESFTRLTPPDPSTPPERMSDLSDVPLDWLPAIQVQGEGVFVRLNNDTLQVWEDRPKVRERVARIEANYIDRCKSAKVKPYRTITPRFVFVHTLAHILINQWSLQCGYPASSLRERLYVDDDNAGILIYTATSDSAGSLGGIVAQGELGKLENALRDAVSTAAWCSADPLCIEAEASGSDSLNLAACHACILLPEVSCELSNVFLDRALLVGTPNDPELGYFHQILGD